MTENDDVNYQQWTDSAMRLQCNSIYLDISISFSEWLVAMLNNEAKRLKIKSDCTQT